MKRQYSFIKRAGREADNLRNYPVQLVVTDVMFDVRLWDSERIIGPEGVIIFWQLQIQLGQTVELRLIGAGTERGTYLPSVYEEDLMPCRSC